MILQLLALGLLIAWAAVVWGIPGGLLAGAGVLFFVGMAVSGLRIGPLKPRPASVPEEGQTWIS